MGVREKRGENNGQNGNLPGARVIAEPEERRYFFIFLTRSWRRKRDTKFTRKREIAKRRNKEAGRGKSSNSELACVRACVSVLSCSLFCVRCVLMFVRVFEWSEMYGRACERKIE